MIRFVEKAKYLGGAADLVEKVVGSAFSRVCDWGTDSEADGKSEVGGAKFGVLQGGLRTDRWIGEGWPWEAMTVTRGDAGTSTGMGLGTRTGKGLVGLSLGIATSATPVAISVSGARFGVGSWFGSGPFPVSLLGGVIWY